MLISAGTKEWDVDEGVLDIVEGVITGAGKPAPMGELIVAAAKLEVPAEPRLRDASEWKIIGNAQTRLDSPVKVNGQAHFAMDVHLDNQMVAMVRRTPQRGGTVVTFDDRDSKEVEGFIIAQALPTGHGVVV